MAQTVIPAHIKPRKASPASLQKVRDKIAEARDVAEQIVAAEQELSELKAKYHSLTRLILPEMFNSVGTNIIGLDAKGNHLAVLAERKPYYRANIAAEWPLEKRQAAFAYLKRQDAEDLIKNLVSIPFGKGTAIKQKRVASFLDKQKIEFSNKLSVHSGTLTAWLKAEVEAGRLPELEKIGGDVGEIVTLKTPKEDR